MLKRELSIKMGLFNFFSNWGTDTKSKKALPYMGVTKKQAKKSTDKKFSYSYSDKRNKKEIQRIIDENPNLLKDYDKQTLRKTLRDANVNIQDGTLYRTDYVPKSDDEEDENVTPFALFEDQAPQSSLQRSPVSQSDFSQPAMCYSPLATRLPSSNIDDHDEFNEPFLRRDEFGHQVDKHGIVYISDDDADV